ncbi:hypothetical protein ACFY5D_03470 [Paeniglutamicibacter sp. NPDC012692]|uniref:hypothetical protein n=1 Tax=Paeniglutamicibacter sp. NPDC012692 TaxID=3364388 RepID=UPI0036C8B22A
MTNTFPARGIQALILNKKRDRSMESLSQACGGVPTRANLQRLVSSPVKTFPKDNDVILGLSRGLGVRVSDIVTAFAISLGLPVNADDQSSLTLEGAGSLPEASKEVLRSMADNMLWWRDEVKAAESKPAAPAFDPDDPSNYDLAAHPNFETDRDRFNKAHGGAGEENQDPDGEA